jgi:hypothetical protein
MHTMQLHEIFHAEQSLYDQGNNPKPKQRRSTIQTKNGIPSTLERKISRDIKTERFPTSTIPKDCV